MTTDVKLKQVFKDPTPQAKAKDSDAEVPERIQKHAPTPTLKPGGSWRARADQVDRQVREKQEVKKAKNGWDKRLKGSLRKGKGFNLKA